MPKTPSRFPSGLTNAGPESALQRFGLPDPSSWHQWFDDFDRYVAADWVVTGTSSSEALEDEDGGILKLNTAVDLNASSYLQWSGGTGTNVTESFTFETGKQFVFKSRFKVLNLVNSSFVMGMQVTDTTPLAASTGVAFTNVDANLIFVVQNGGNTTTLNNVATLVNNTYVELAYYYNGTNNIAVFVNDVAVIDAPTTNLPTSEVTLSFGIRNDTAATVRSMSIDYILAAKER